MSHNQTENNSKRQAQKATSSQIAIGGVFAALCLVIMFSTAFIPFGTYALPCLAGAMLVVVVIENGRNVAWMVYVSVSLLSILIVPDKEAVLVFVVFLGYYPIIKSNLERFCSRLVEYFCKLALFNFTIISGYAVMAYVFGLSELIADLGDLGRIGMAVLIFLANVVFILYDVALTRYCIIYVRRIRQSLVRRR